MISSARPRASGVIFAIGFAMSFLLGIVSFIGLILFSTNLLARAECHTKADAMGVNWSYSFLQQCMIVVDGKNTPLSAYKVVKVSP